MEPISFASFTLAGILSTFAATGEQASQAVITTHISPAIAGQWQVDLERTEVMSNRLAEIARADEELEFNQSELKNVDDELAVTATSIDGVLEQNERHSISIEALSSGDTVSDSDQSVVARSIRAAAIRNNQCRELYNFATDNEMRAVSGKETTFGRYIVTHREEGLPIIAMKTTYDNNEPDCSGNQIDQTGDALVAFLKHDGNNMQWCADSEGVECFMDFYKVLP